MSLLLRSDQRWTLSCEAARVDLGQGEGESESQSAKATLRVKVACVDRVWAPLVFRRSDRHRDVVDGHLVRVRVWISLENEGDGLIEIRGGSGFGAAAEMARGK